MASRGLWLMNRHWSLDGPRAAYNDHTMVKSGARFQVIFYPAGRTTNMLQTKRESILRQSPNDTGFRLPITGYVIRVDRAATIKAEGT